MAGPEILRKIVVKISIDKKMLIGTGFFVSEKEIVTCHHVLADNSGLLSESYFVKNDDWDDWIRAEPIEGKCKATQDFAFLSCPVPIKIGPGRIPFKPWDGKSKEFRSRGYDCNISEDEGASSVEGDDCKIVDRTSRGKEPRWQLSTIKKTLLQGRSGSPVWSVGQEAIVGMIDYGAGNENEQKEKSMAILIERLMPIQSSMSGSSVPIVIVAMNEEEANLLKNGDILTKDELIMFRAFEKALQDHNIVDWENNYGKRRDEWKPQLFPEMTIRDIINEILNKIRDLKFNPGDGVKGIECTILSNDFLDLDSDENLYGNLSKSGCILIIDSISLFHPKIRKAVLQSQLLSQELINKKIILTILYPINHSVLLPNYMVENFIIKEIPSIKEPDFGGHYSAICDPRVFKRKLLSSFPTAKKRIDEFIREKNMSQVTEYFGQDRTEYYSFISGENR